MFTDFNQTLIKVNLSDFVRIVKNDIFSTKVIYFVIVAVDTAKVIIQQHSKWVTTLFVILQQ